MGFLVGFLRCDVDFCWFGHILGEDFLTFFWRCWDLGPKLNWGVWMKLNKIQEGFQDESYYTYNISIFTLCIYLEPKWGPLF